jgi:hypothetical protein
MVPQTELESLFPTNTGGNNTNTNGGSGSGTSIPFAAHPSPNNGPAAPTGSRQQPLPPPPRGHTNHPPLAPTPQTGWSYQIPPNPSGPSYFPSPHPPAPPPTQHQHWVPWQYPVAGGSYPPAPHPHGHYQGPVGNPYHGVVEPTPGLGPGPAPGPSTAPSPSSYPHPSQPATPTWSHGQLRQPPPRRA